MSNMRSSTSEIAEILAKLSTSTQGMTDADARRIEFWKYLPQVSDAVVRYLKQVTGRHSYLEQATMYVDDPSFMQSAAAMILELRFSVDDELTVRVVCLIDHSRISVTVSRSATTAECETIAGRIRSEA